MEVGSNTAVFSFKNEATIRVDTGQRITVKINPDLDDNLIRFFVLGWGMATILYQRGFLVLHGSAVAIQGRVAAFIGVPGAGKSSLAASLYSRGHSIVTDDNLAVASMNGTLRVSPAFPQLRVSPAVAQALGIDLRSLVPLNDHKGKFGLRIGKQFADSRLPLNCIYIIEEGAELEITPVGYMESIIELTRHSFPTRIRKPANAQHFLNCSSLAKAIPIYRLKRPKLLGLLPELSRSIEAHIMTI